MLNTHDHFSVHPFKIQWRQWRKQVHIQFTSQVYGLVFFFFSFECHFISKIVLWGTLTFSLSSLASKSFSHVALGGLFKPPMPLLHHIVKIISDIFWHLLCGKHYSKNLLDSHNNNVRYMSLLSLFYDKQIPICYLPEVIKLWNESNKIYPNQSGFTTYCLYIYAKRILWQSPLVVNLSTYFRSSLLIWANGHLK